MRRFCWAKRENACPAVGRGAEWGGSILRPGCENVYTRRCFLLIVVSALCLAPEKKTKLEELFTAEEIAEMRAKAEKEFWETIQEKTRGVCIRQSECFAECATVTSRFCEP
jgi:hypothetical protein